MKALSKAGHCMHTHSRCTFKQANDKYFQQLLHPAIENIHLSFGLYFLLAAQNLNPYSTVGKSTTWGVLVGSQALFPLSPEPQGQMLSLPEVWPQGVFRQPVGAPAHCTHSRSLRGLVLPTTGCSRSNSAPCQDSACFSGTNSFLSVF